MRIPHVRHLEYRTLQRTRHSHHFLHWLSAQATRLALTAQQVFNLLSGGLTAAQVSAVGKVANTAVPTITGTPKVGTQLTATNGTWSGGPTAYSYQWLIAGVAVAGATASTYTPVAGDATKTVAVRVTARNAATSATATSANGTVSA